MTMPFSQAAPLSRRQFLAAGAAAASLPSITGAREPEASGFRFRFLLASSLYGYGDLEKVVQQVQPAGAQALDIWPKVHGNQREQLDEMGEEAFAELLRRHDVPLGCITQYKLGPFGLQDEMRLARRLGCRMIVTGASGPKDLEGAELKSAVGQFVEQMKPHLAVAEETGVTIAIENHGNSLIQSPESILWLAEMRPSTHLAIALAPYHLPQDSALIADLVRKLGPAMSLFYAWQHGAGSQTEQPKEKELLQLPGRGPLDFAPIVHALRETDYEGWTEVFMHPYPRGLPMHERIEDVTEEVRRGATYLQDLAARV